MLLTVSIGNTNISYAVFDGAHGSARAPLSMTRHDRLPLAHLPLLAQRIGALPFRRIALASVAPGRTEQAIALLSGSYNAAVLVAGRDLPYGIEIQCDEPEKVGADRLLNAVAAHARTRAGAIVADIGTAITVDVVSARGDFCGGAIAPGPDLMLRALHEHTGLLPVVAYEKPPSVIGRNTVAAMRSGAHWGAVALVESLIERMAQELSMPIADCRLPSGAFGNRKSEIGIPVLLTGGGAEPIARDMKRSFDLVPALTLEGLAILAGRA